MENCKNYSDFNIISVVRVYYPEFKKNHVKNLIKGGWVKEPYDLFNIFKDKVQLHQEFLPMETYSLEPEDNDGYPTIEIYENDKMIWENSCGEFGTKQKEYGLICCIIRENEIVKGTLFNSFDLVYDIADEFYREYNQKKVNWEETDFEETVVEFAKSFIKNKI